MHVEHLFGNSYQIDLTPDEQDHMFVVIENLKDAPVCTIESLIQYVMMHIEQNWFMTIEEVNPNGDTDSTRSDPD